MSVRAVSYGGGVQSTALLVLAAQGRIDFPLFLFANTGDDSEHPHTLRYVREIAKPYASAHGVEVVELHKMKSGKLHTLRAELDAGKRSIPVRRYKDGPPMGRTCTSSWKIRVVEAELRRRGVTAADPALVAMGISVDEIERARSEGVDDRSPLQDRTYPLLTLGLHRSDCRKIIADAGLPIPPKSACYFCPFHDREAWRSLKAETPDLFAAACAIEANLTASATDGRAVYLTRSGIPLADTIDDQLTLDGMDGCDSGWCFT